MSEEVRPMQQTMEQRRARQAWKDVESISLQLGPKYVTQARKLPSLIQVNGLAQTLAFLTSKDDEAMRRTYAHLSSWVGQQMDTTSDLLQSITRWSSDEYRRATAEALAYALWLRRLAEAKEEWGEGEEEN